MSTASAYLTVRGIDVDVIYKDIKNLHIGVYPPLGRVRVAAPERPDDEQVRLAVIQRLPWIKRQREQLKAAPRQTEREMVTGESHFVWGVRKRLKVVERPGRTHFEVDGDRLVLYTAGTTTADQRRAALDQWNRQQLREAIHSGWRHTMSLLARRELMKATVTNLEVILESLTDLFRAGAKKELVLATRKLGDDGPAEPLVALTARLDLESTPRSCLQSALAFLRYAGDFANAANADRHAAWLIASLENADELRERLKPLFLIETSMLEALGGLMRSISLSMRRRVMDHLLSLPVIDDQSVASGYGRIVALLGDDDWTEDDLSRLSARTDDNWELQDDIDGVLAASDPDFRIGLQEKIRQGDLTALGNFGKVTELPEDVAGGAITHLVSGIETQVAQARSGMYGLGGPELGQALVVLNAWHPNVAEWDVVGTLLDEPKSHPSHILGTLHTLGRIAEQLPDAQKVRLKRILEGIADRPAYERDTALIPSNSSPQSAAKLALLRIFPEELMDVKMQGLLAGAPSDREVAATLAGERRAEGDQNLLVSLSRDPEPQVRAAAIVGLAKWLAGEEDGAELSARVQALVEAGGPLTAKQVSGYLLDMPSSGTRQTLLRSLADHPSALVRARVAAGLTD